MKKGRRLIRYTLLALCGAVVLYVAASRWHGNDNATPVQRQPLPTASELALLRDFNSIVVSGNLAVEIVQQAGYTVEFIPGAGAGTSTGSFTTSIQAHALMVNGFRNAPGDLVRIGMPVLTSVIGDGVRDLSISGFSGDSISLKLAAARVSVRSSAILQWHVVGSDNVRLQFDQASITAGKLDLVGRVTLAVD